MSKNFSKGGTGAGFGLIMIFFALAFIAGPFMYPVVSGISQLILVGFGVFLFIVGAVVLIITHLYVKTSADEAFVRTGMGGQKVIIDGGAIVISVVHKVVPVSLVTMRLDVERRDQDALITGDKLRADIRAEFYIKVQKDRDSVVNAATSLGQRMVNASTVKELVNEKLISALRTVAATKSLEDLNAKRDEFAEAVQKIVSTDLRHNGLTLESVTVSQLDQTPPDKMKAGTNIFDAQGTRQIAEITQLMRAETNALERQADKVIKEQDVEKDKFVYEQEVARASAEARQISQIQKANAEAKQKAATFKAEQEEMTAVREAKRDQAVAVANVEREEKVQVADVERERAKQVADIERQKAVAASAEERAKAEAAQKEAEAKRESADQKIQTVAVTEEAKRTAEKDYIEKARRIDQEAYQTERQAEAQRKAAEMDAEARRLKAAAEMDALKAEADGEKAKQMVPVHVEKENVAVEQKRINDVLQPELKAKADFKEISVQLKVRLKEIEVSGDVQKSFAAAMGQAFRDAKINIFGDPAAMEKMMGMFQKGQAAANLIDGFTEKFDPGVVETAGDLLADLKNTLLPPSNKSSGSKPLDDVFTTAMEKLTSDPTVMIQIRDRILGGDEEKTLIDLIHQTLGREMELKTVENIVKRLREHLQIIEHLKTLDEKKPQRGEKKPKPAESKKQKSKEPAEATL